ncbi:MAG: polyprenyl synthetase family protein [Bacteroidales bacterium]|nr:polyprenyl synthetase family protein [Bacteroidales bacterium]
MNVNINKIKEPVEEELLEFKNFFNNILKTDNKLLNIVLQYIIRNKGKELRPILVFLSAKLVNHVTEATFVAASMVELMHTATLIHDDVVDNSQLRRSNFSIKALWKSKLAVLVGDYMLAQGLKLSVKTKSFNILEIVSTAVQEMAEGELMQIEKARKLNITEDIYFEIIRKKTASLLIASAKAGAASVNASEDQLNSIENFALNLGVAFQIKDDLFDYSSTTNIGKPEANDLQESKLTLPLLYSLNRANKTDRKKIFKILGKKVKTFNEIKIVQNFVKQSGGIDYAKSVLEDYSKQAIDELQTFDDSMAKKSLIELVGYVVLRKK